MKCFFTNGNRFAAFIIIFACMAALSGCASPTGPSTDTPAAGTPEAAAPTPEGAIKEVFVDREGNIVEEDQGITALIVKTEAGHVRITADTTGEKDTVTVDNPRDGSVVIMTFRKRENFPYRMFIRQRFEAYDVHISPYYSEKSNYNVTIQKVTENWMPTRDNIPLDRSVFDIDLPETADEGQRKRLRHIAVARAVCESLAADLETATSPPFLSAVGKIFENICEALGG